jgi:hypothetical protein
MSGEIPFMRVRSSMGTEPCQRVINKINAVVASGLIFRKQIALENGLSQTKMSQYMNSTCRVKGWRDVDTILEKWADRWREQRSKGDDYTGSKQEIVNCQMSAKNNDITTPYISSEVQQFDITLADANYWDGVEGWSWLNVLPLPENFMESENCDQYGIHSQ